jgi:hypothetical protein
MEATVTARAIFRFNFPKRCPQEERRALIEGCVRGQMAIERLVRWSFLLKWTSRVHPIEVERVEIIFKKIIENYVEDSSMESEVCGKQVSLMDRQQKGVLESWEVLDIER